MSRTARVVIASTRAAAGVYEDRTGPVIVAWLAERGFDVPAPVVVTDGAPVGAELRRAIADDVDVVLVHDAARPLTPADQIQRVVAALRDGQAHILRVLESLQHELRIGAPAVGITGAGGLGLAAPAPVLAAQPGAADVTSDPRYKELKRRLLAANLKILELQNKVASKPAL